MIAEPRELPSGWEPKGDRAHDRGFPKGKVPEVPELLNKAWRIV